MSRTVGVMLKTTSRDLVRTWLNGAMDQNGDEWAIFSPERDDVILYIHIMDNIRNQFEPESYDEVTRIFGEEPSVCVIADISGRFDADDQVKLFVTSILNHFEGVAFDEYTDHWWTLEEIQSDLVVDGFHYFDYRENYRRYFNKHEEL